LGQTTILGYLFRDILELENLKSVTELCGLLEAVALQLGNEGSRFRVWMMTASPPEHLDKERGRDDRTGHGVRKRCGSLVSFSSHGLGGRDAHPP